MAIAPIDQVREVLDHAVSEIPRNKILMGISLRALDWTLPYPSGGRASGLSHNSAQNLAVVEKVPIQWNATAASPYFRYTREAERHEVWFEDALSIAVKFQLVQEYNLRGLSYWALPSSFPQNWYLLRDTFTVRKQS